MAQRREYRTRQREAVMACFLAEPGRGLTADEVRAELAKVGQAVGRTTVYRTLARLQEQGWLAAFKDASPASPVRYQHRGLSSRHISVRCSGCGMIAALDCEAVTAFEEHLSLEHGFILKEDECLLPGFCNGCRPGQTNTFKP